ncbi:MAG: hypothetical protein KC731_29680 [Myxococcales bacterium]|nr:hypothetical protein [Myxococcales bacterium]
MNQVGAEQVFPARDRGWDRRAILGGLVGLAVASLVGVGCNKPTPGSPEAVGDAFVDAYFRRADQAAAKEFTAFGATKMLDDEIAEVKGVRDSGYSPTDASLAVEVTRGERRMRDARVRLDYQLRYPGRDGVDIKHADVELAEVDGSWKVVRLGLSKDVAP